MPHAAARAALAALGQVELGLLPTPLEPLERLRSAIGAAPRLCVKRDDALGFGFGGNKVRKLRLVAAQARAAGADVLVTTGGVQSNHCRATAAAAAKLGLGCHLVLNGEAPATPSANLLLDRLLGAEIELVRTREERAPALRAACERLRAAGRRPFEVPLGASTPLGAAAFALAFGELVETPDVIFHASSSGGTQAGLVAGTVLWGASTRVIGVSADEPAAVLRDKVRTILLGLETLLQLEPGTLADARPIEVEDGFIGPGYGSPTPESREAQQWLARSEAIVVDHWYTAKAAAALIARLRAGAFSRDARIVFWHTGGQVGVFA